MDKNYIETYYKGAIADYKIAANDDQRHAAIDAMARLENLAATMYGFAYADSLNKIAKESLRGCMVALD